MALGRYPIPLPTESEVAELFKMDPTGLSPRSEGLLFCGQKQYRKNSNLLLI
jgi:hypothetical protein